MLGGRELQMDGAAQPFVQVRVPYVLDGSQEVAGTCAYDNLQTVGGSEKKRRRSIRQSPPEENAGVLYDQYQQYDIRPLGSHLQVPIHCCRT